MCAGSHACPQPEGPCALDTEAKDSVPGDHDESEPEVSEDEDLEDNLDGTHTCRHYDRHCLLKAPCCNKYYWCRWCHDEIEDHDLNTDSVEEIVCAQCLHVQAVDAVCLQCGIIFGSYFCRTCRLYDDIPRQQFHCDACGVCRLGGRENYFHCYGCDACLSSEVRDNHTCIEGAVKRDCPLCLESLFFSREQCGILGCGHVMHLACVQALADQFGLACRCPVCMQPLFETRQSAPPAKSKSASNELSLGMSMLSLEDI